MCKCVLHYCLRESTQLQFNNNNNNNIPVIIGATGTISKSFRKCVSTIPGNHELKELQKTAISESADVKVH
jgi:hypothetical protein